MTAPPDAPDATRGPSPRPEPLSGRADFWSGLMALAVGGTVLAIGWDYKLGEARQLGPGYMPRLLGAACLALGIALVIRSRWRRDPIDRSLNVRVVGLVLGAVLAFALAFGSLGLAPAILVTVTIAAFAAPDNGLATGVGIGTVLAVFAAVLFVYGLGLPLPILIWPPRW